MKYPKEYAQKAMDVIGEAYLPDDESTVSNVELLTMVAMCMHMIACSMSEETGNSEEEIFEMIKMGLTMPEPYEN